MQREPDDRAGIRVNRFDSDDGRVGSGWLWLDSPLVDPSPDAAAAAAALAFGHLVGSVFEPPQGMSSQMAEAVFGYLGHRHLRLAGVRNTIDRHRGTQTLRLHAGHDVDHGTDEIDGLNLYLVSGDTHYGQQLSRGALAIPSNARFFATLVRSDHSWKVDVAAALLVTSRLDVGRIRLVGYGVTQKDLPGASRLALSAGVRLELEAP